MTSLMALLALASPICSMSSAGMAVLRGRHGGEGRIDAVRGLGRVAGDLEVDQGRVAVARDRAGAGQRRLHVLDVRPSRQAARHVLDRRPELRVLERELVALDEHGLLDRPQAGAVKRNLGAVGLARELIDVGDVVRADHVAEP